MKKIIFCAIMLVAFKINIYSQNCECTIDPNNRFELTYVGPVTNQEKDIFCAITNYLSTVILNTPQYYNTIPFDPNPGPVCAPQLDKVRIEILKADTVTTAGVYGTGISYMLPRQPALIAPSTCDQLRFNMANSILIGGYNSYTRFKDFHGQVTYNSESEFLYGCDYPLITCTDFILPDFFTVMLHEFMHVLGVGGAIADYNRFSSVLTVTDAFGNSAPFFDCTDTCDLINPLVKSASLNTSSWSDLTFSYDGVNTSPSSLLNNDTHVHLGCERFCTRNFTYPCLTVSAEGPSIGANVIRDISEYEQQLLCEMGYKTPFCDDLDSPLTPCSFFPHRGDFDCDGNILSDEIFVCVGDSYTFTKASFLADFYSDEAIQIIGAKLVLDPNDCAPNTITLSQTSTSFTLDNFTPGDRVFLRLCLQSCCFNYEIDIAFYGMDCTTNCVASPPVGCKQKLCYIDFETYTPGRNAAQGFGGLPFSIFQGTPCRPSILYNNQTNNKFVELSNLNGIAIDLNGETIQDEWIKIQYKAGYCGSGDSNYLYVQGTEFPPCLERTMPLLCYPNYPSLNGSNDYDCGTFGATLTNPVNVNNNPVSCITNVDLDLQILNQTETQCDPQSCNINSTADLDFFTYDRYIYVEDKFPIKYLYFFSNTHSIFVDDISISRACPPPPGVLINEEMVDLHPIKNSADSKSEIDLLKFNVFPNPSSGDISISLENSDEVKTTFEIYAIDGRMMFSKEVFGRQEKIDIKDLSVGVYFIHAIRKGSRQTQKFIIGN